MLGSPMRRYDVSLYIVLAALAATVVFVAYALSGADTCLWC